MRSVFSSVGSLARVILWPVLFLGRVLRRLAGSFRFWVLLVLAVLAVLVAYYALAERYTPFTADAFVQAYVIQVAPQVSGQVVRVHVAEGEQVQSGVLLFELDPRPFEHRITYLEAKQVEAEQQVKQLSAELAAARANHERIVAEEGYAGAVYRQEQQIYKTDSTTQRKYLDALQKHKASQAAVQQSAEGVRRIEDALNARIAGEHTLVAQVKAQLAEARLNLAYSRVYAPCAGMITNLQLRDGAYVHTGQAALALIDTAHWLVVGNFRENSLSRLHEGQPALIGLRGEPGQLFRARVFAVGGGVSQGQGVPSGLLPDVKRPAGWIPPSQRFQVRLVLEEPETVPLRVGMTGSASVYTEPDGWLNDITRGWHQLIAWLYYF